MILVEHVAMDNIDSFFIKRGCSAATLRIPHANSKKIIVR
ncbi:hypothetical protein DSUL_20245 [Desulfovibrionales bacterium]